jgi:hypothetical protein
MTRCRYPALALIAALAGGGSGCQLRRPDVPPVRMIEPQLPEPASPAPSARQGGSAADATPIRLVDTQARGHIGRRLLHQQANGELIEDPIWRWSSAPGRYLDSELRLALSSSPDVRLVDTGNASVMAVTLIAWQLESAGNPRLVGAVEVDIIGTNHTVRTHLIRANEPVSSELPGDLAAAAGRLLHTLASESLRRATQASS